MPAFLAPLLISGISALAGGLGNRAQKQTQNTTSTTNSTNTTRPDYDPKTATVRDFLLNTLMDRTALPENFQQNYLNEGVANINRGADANSNAVRQAMISRGLGRTSAGLAPEIATEGSRFQQLASFQNNAPLALDEMQRKRIMDLSQFFSSLPVGSVQTGNQTTTGNATSTTPSNMLGGALQGGAQMAAFLYGNGAFGGKK